MQRQQGQEVVEFAIIAPLLLLLLLGIIEFALIIFSYNSIAQVAREGARAGVVRTATQADVVHVVAVRLGQLGLTDHNQVVDLQAGTVRVSITCDVHLLTGTIIQALGGNPEVRLHTVATMQRE